MIRKLVRQGAATLMVSIPAKWAKQFSLGKGSEVDVAEEDSSVIITAGKASEKKIKEIEIEKGMFLRRMVWMPYREGYDEIKIKFEDPKTMIQIESATEMLIGFEIIDQKPGQCTIGTVSEESEQSFESVLRRCFLLIKTMANESQNAMLSREFEKMASIAAMERSVHRYCDFTMRIINRSWLKPKPEITRTYWIITILKEISDMLEATCLEMGIKKPRMQKDIELLYRKTVSLIGNLSELYYKHGMEELVSAKNAANSARELGKRIMSKQGGIICHNLLDIAERVIRAQELLA